MFTDDVVVDEAGRLQFCRDVPPNGSRGRRCQPRNPRDVLQQAAPLSCPHGPGCRRQACQHEHQRALGQQSNRQAGKQQDHAVAIPRPVQGLPQATQGERGADHEGCVGHHGAGRYQGQGRTAQQAEGGQRWGVAARRRQSAACRGDEQHAEEVGQPGRELVDAEHLHADRGEPERQRRLGPERHAMVMPRRDPIAQFEHLAADLGIARLGGVHQRQPSHGEEAQRQQCGDEQHRGQHPGLGADGQPVTRASAFHRLRQAT